MRRRGVALASAAAEISSMPMPNMARLRVNSGRSASSAPAASPPARCDLQAQGDGPGHTAALQRLAARAIASTLKQQKRTGGALLAACSVCCCPKQQGTSS